MDAHLTVETWASRAFAELTEIGDKESLILRPDAFDTADANSQ